VVQSLPVPPTLTALSTYVPTLDAAVAGVVIHAELLTALKATFMLLVIVGLQLQSAE
jgi:hypothetical protein